MKYTFFTISILLLLAIPGQAENNAPFKVHGYGSFKKILETKNTGGIVSLERALSAPHTYAVGELNNAAGEITAYDGNTILNYGESRDIERSLTEIAPGEKAMQLITAEVTIWREVAIPRTMTDTEFNVFVLAQARKAGLNVKLPFPFLIQGSVNNLVWHVLSGADAVSNEKEMFLKKRVKYREKAAVIFVGFCSELQYDYALPGESWHLHVIFPNENTTGHVDAFSVSKGATLKLPVVEKPGNKDYRDERP